MQSLLTILNRFTVIANIIVLIILIWTICLGDKTLILGSCNKQILQPQKYAAVPGKPQFIKEMLTLP